MERRSLHALRRAARRRPPGGAAAARRRHRDGDHRRHLRAGRRGCPARPRAAGSADATTTRWSARSATTSTRASATGRAGFPRFTDPRLRGPDEYDGVRADGGRALARAARRRRLRPAAAAQPRSHGLHEHGGVGRAGGGSGGRPDAASRRRARAGQRVHARRHRLLRALRRAHRLGDADPQPARALAGRAGARGGRAPRCGRDHARRRLRRALPRRRPRGPRVRARRPSRLPARRDGSRRAGRSSTACGRSPSVTG